MESDQNKIIPFVDCQGTCKTPIGCTCDKANNNRTESVAGTSEKKCCKTKDKASRGGCGCSSGGSCGCSSGGGCGCSSKGGGSCCSSKNKLEVFDWLRDVPADHVIDPMVEVQFKNTRKAYYINSTNIDLYKGDIIAVEATPGHDIGEVTLTGKLVELQIRKNNYRGEIKRVYRIAKPSDLEKYEEAKAKEHKTMIRAREIAEELQLNMKISDVEYQGDGNKAIFYYIADERVDFRQLIKVYASEFRVKIEMKQIGARQEAGRVGGIGPCGRELCCSGYMSNFVSVSTSAARLQDIPLNPQKLAGQCGKLKCCLNFEVDTYVEAQQKLPSRDIVLETKDASFFHFKTDILSGAMTYSTDKHFAANLITVTKDRAYEVIRMNKAGKKPLTLATEEQVEEKKPVSHDVLDQDITRFDNTKNNNRRGSNNNNRKKTITKNRPQNGDSPREQEDNKSGQNNNRNSQNRRNNQNRTDRDRSNNSENRNSQQANTEANPNKPNNNNRNRRNRPQRNERKDNNNKTEE